MTGRSGSKTDWRISAVLQCADERAGEHELWDLSRVTQGLAHLTRALATLVGQGAVEVLHRRSNVLRDPMTRDEEFHPQRTSN